jgi:Mg-chelatase subunit ChlD
MKTPVLITALFLLTTAAVLAWGERSPITPVSQPPIPDQQQARIDAVFVLDTTGSMGGLIEAARENIWSIASNMASAQPTPELRIGLVAFRDRGDAYVTRVTDLSTDLDAVYAELMGFRADGGGDFPEAVNEALHDAVHKITWSQDDDAYKVIFLVGDAPPHMNYPDDVKYPETLAIARQRGIVVNTIQAGQHPQTRHYWQEIAGLGQGAFFQVGMQGNAVAVHTPFDAEIARVSRELDGTRLFYGDAERQRELAVRTETAERLHSTASPSAMARRAEFNASSAGRKNFLAEADLVEDIASGKAELDSLPSEQLPKPIAELPPEARAQAVAEIASQRAELQERLSELGKQRRAHIAEALSESKDLEQSLDHQIFEVVKQQAATKGLSYEAAPVH